ncbi:hypothetical protein NMY22_g16010 [Coprinellus aureogranulatus]|nr:hypothetical protein NMY22_g16010 [Coprinellus aureogranulatus]
MPASRGRRDPVPFSMPREPKRKVSRIQHFPRRKASTYPFLARTFIPRGVLDALGPRKRSNGGSTIVGRTGDTSTFRLDPNSYPHPNTSISSPRASKTRSSNRSAYRRRPSVAIPFVKRPKRDKQSKSRRTCGYKTQEAGTQRGVEGERKPIPERAVHEAATDLDIRRTYAIQSSIRELRRPRSEQDERVRARFGTRRRSFESVQGVYVLGSRGRRWASVGSLGRCELRLVHPHTPQRASKDTSKAYAERERVVELWGVWRRVSAFEATCTSRGDWGASVDSWYTANRGDSARPHLPYLSPIVYLHQTSIPAYARAQTSTFDAHTPSPARFCARMRPTTQGCKATPDSVERRVEYAWIAYEAPGTGQQWHNVYLYMCSRMSEICDEYTAEHGRMTPLERYNFLCDMENELCWAMTISVVTESRYPTMWKQPVLQQVVKGLTSAHPEDPDNYRVDPMFETIKWMYPVRCYMWWKEKRPLETSYHESGFEKFDQVIKAFEDDRAVEVNWEDKLYRRNRLPETEDMTTRKHAQQARTATALAMAQADNIAGKLQEKLAKLTREMEALGGRIQSQPASGSTRVDS